jgi:hypothetical protein
MLGIKQEVHMSAYRPSTNGQTERFNCTVADFMAAIVSEHQRDWDELAAVATYSYNSKPHSSTGFSPFELVTSVPQAAILPQVEIPVRQSRNTKPRIRDEFLATVAESCAMARENLATSQLRYKKAYDAHVREVSNELALGDLTYVKTFVAPKELSKNLILPAVGPFVVTRVGKYPHTFKIQTSDGYVTTSADRIRNVLVRLTSPKV